MSSLVAVYGTLRKGMGNNPLMGDSKFVGEAKIEGFDMYPVHPTGGFPVIFPTSEPNTITVEVFEVSDERRDGPLDRLEGHPTWYRRELVTTPYGEAWIYVMQDERYKEENPRILDGDFVNFVNSNK